MHVGGTTPYRGAVVSAQCFVGYFNPNGSPISWSIFPSMTSKRCGHSLVTLFDGSLVAMGGYSGDVSYLSSVERLDLERGRWIELASMECRRSGAGCVLGNDGCIYIAGGSPDGNTGLSSFERLDLREGRWQRLANMT
jgi:hypothetical protein